MKTNAKRLFAGLFLGLAAVLWVAHATDGPAKIDSNSKVIADNTTVVLATIPFTTITVATASFKLEVAGNDINQVVSSLDTTPMKTEGGGALCAMTPKQDVSINSSSVIGSTLGTTPGATAATITGADLLANGANGPLAVANAAFAFAGTSLTPFSAAGHKEVPAPEIVGGAA